MSASVHPVMQVAQENCGDLLESPFWNTTTNTLLYVDIDGKRIHKYQLDTESHTSWKTSQRIGFICPVSSSPQADVVIGGMEDGMYWLDLSTNTCVEKQLWTHNLDTHIVRFNDGKCDSSGRLFSGLMDYHWQEKPYSEAQGKFYSFQSSRRHRKAELTKQAKKNTRSKDMLQSQELLSQICCSNGLTWLSDNQHLFYIDSGKYEILCYPYDIQTGNIDKDKKQTLVRLDKKTTDEFFVLDGMCCDIQDKLWVALCGAGVVLQIDAATGKELMRISVGCKFPTSVCFGGPHLDILFVTTARETTHSSGFKYQGGSLFMVQVPGVRSARSAYPFLF